MTETEYRDSIRSICARNGATKAVLFGSRARGDNAPWSDFDIAVYGVRDTRPIVDEIDALPTLYSCDVVNMERLGNRSLTREVEAHGVPL